MIDLVSLDEIRAARERVKGAARFTPIVDVPYPNHRGWSLFLKAENLQPMGAFKIRGAFNMLAQIHPRIGGVASSPIRPAITARRSRWRRRRWARLR